MKYVFDALTCRKHVLVCLQRDGAGLSFVSHKKSVFLRVFKISYFQLYCRKNMFWFVCRRIALFLLRNGSMGKRFPASFVTKLHFWRPLFPKTFWVFFATKVEASSLISQKTAIWFYRCKIRCFKLHITNNMFCFVNNSIGLPWALSCKKSVFAFLLLKHVAISFIA